MPEGERRLAAIMFTDIVGYTSLTQKDEKLALSLLDKHRELVRPVVSQHGGREIKTMGDAFLIEFASALEATESAVEIQKALSGYNREASERFLVRIGIHVGDVVHSGQDVYGDAVNIASRIEPLAEPGGICISEQVFAQVRNKVPYRLERLPAHSLKNVQYPVDAYRVVLSSEDVQPEVAAPKNRVAVLPLSNISPDPRDGYFADGMTEELITVLSQVQGLRVIARTSVDHYRSRDQRVVQIGRELGVGSLIEGSVRIAGDRLRVTVQLVDAANEEHLWSENYDRMLNDIFAVQSDIAKRVAKKLEVKLKVKEEDRLDRRGAKSMASYRHYLRGRALLARRNPKEMMEAKQLFEKSLDEDPTYAPAYSGLADTYHLLGSYWAMPVDESRRKSDEFLSKAIRLDPELGESHAGLGRNLSEEYKWAEAVSEFKRAIELNPSYAMAHMWYAQCLGSLRRYKEEEEELRIAEQMDPLSPVIQWNLGFLFALLGRMDEAWAKVMRLAELYPDTKHTIELESICYSISGEPQKSLDLLMSHPEYHDDVFILIGLASSSADLGDRAAALRWLEKLLALPDSTARKEAYVSFVYLQLHEYDQFFATANKAVDKKEMEFGQFELLPEMKPLLDDPRWKALLGRVDLDHD